MMDAIDVATASHVRLTCITYRVLIEQISNILNDKDKVSSKIIAVQAVKTLMSGVDLRVSIGQDLLTLYIFVQKSIIQENLNDIRVSVKIIENLLEAYESIEQEELKTKAIVAPVYGAYGLEYVDINSCTSFKA